MSSFNDQYNHAALMGGALTTSQQKMAPRFRDFYNAAAILGGSHLTPMEQALMDDDDSDMEDDSKLYNNKALVGGASSATACCACDGDNLYNSAALLGGKEMLYNTAALYGGASLGMLVNKRGLPKEKRLLDVGYTIYTDLPSAEQNNLLLIAKPKSQEDYHNLYAAISYIYLVKSLKALVAHGGYSEESKKKMEKLMAALVKMLQNSGESRQKITKAIMKRVAWPDMDDSNIKRLEKIWGKIIKDPKLSKYAVSGGSFRDRLRAFFEKVKRGFTKVKDTVKKVWNHPITQQVVKTVQDSGILDDVYKEARKHMPGLPDVETIKDLPNWGQERLEQYLDQFGDTRPGQWAKKSGALSKAYEALQQKYNLPESVLQTLKEKGYGIPGAGVIGAGKTKRRKKKGGSLPVPKIGMPNPFAKADAIIAGLDKHTDEKEGGKLDFKKAWQAYTRSYFSPKFNRNVQDKQEGGVYIPELIKPGVEIIKKAHEKKQHPPPPPTNSNGGAYVMSGGAANKLRKSRLVKGSPEAKAYMARLRAMRGKKKKD